MSSPFAESILLPALFSVIFLFNLLFFAEGFSKLLKIQNCSLVSKLGISTSVFVGFWFILSLSKLLLLKLALLSFVVISLFGVKSGVQRIRLLPSLFFPTGLSGAEKAWRSAFLALASFQFGFVVFILRDVAVLPSVHDGMAHAMIFKRIWDVGNPFINFFPVSLVEQFGLNYPYPYPSGSHFLALAIGKPLHLLNIVPTDAYILKSCLISATFLVTISALSITVKLVGKTKYSYAFFALLLIQSYYLTPFHALDSGGYSRILAVGLFSGTFLFFLEQKCKPTLVFLLTLLSLAGCFFTHPATFTYTAIITGLFLFYKAFVHNSGTENNSSARMQKLVTQLLPFAMGALAAAGVVFISIKMAPDFQVSEINLESREGNLAFSPRAVAVRIYHLQKWLFTETKARYTVPPFRSAILLLGLVVGLYSAFFAFIKKKTLDNASLYILISLALANSMMLAIFIKVKPIQMIGSTMYHRPDRIGDLLLPLISTCAVVGIASAIKWLDLISLRLSHYSKRLEKHMQFILIIILVLASGRLGWKSIKVTYQKLDSSFKMYRTPTLQRFSPISQWIRGNYPSNTFLIGEKYAIDSLQSLNEMDTLFMYLMCPSVMPTLNCKNRETFAFEFFTPLKIHLAKIAKNSDTEILPKCTELIHSLPTPSIVIISNNFKEFNPEGRRVCEDLQITKSFADFLILEKI